MAVELIANGVQTVKPGGVVLFDEVNSLNNSTVLHREGSGTATLRPTSGCRCGMSGFKVCFGANIAFPTTPPAGETAATTPVSLAIAVNGEPDTSTEMIVTPAAADEFYNVSRAVMIPVLNSCCTPIAVENTSNGTITVENASLIIEEVRR